MRQRVIRLLAAAGLALTPLVATVLPAAADTPSTSEPPLAIALDGISPTAPQPGDTLVLTGSITNASDGTVSNLGVQLRMSAALVTRGAFDSYAADPHGSVSGLSQALTAIEPLDDPTLAPLASEPFEIEVPLDPATLGLPTTSWQVRELGIQVAGTTAIGTTALGSLRSFLPWAPTTAAGLQPLRVAWIWPLVDRPHRGASGLWLDDGLARSLASGGRLDRLLAAAKQAANQAAAAPTSTNPGHAPPHQDKHAEQNPVQDVPVAWAIDPMLVDDATAMRTSYQVAGSPKPTAGQGEAAARTWLTDLRTATAQADVIPLPYADPDVAAAVRGRLDTLVGVATNTGRTLLSHALPGADLLASGWPPGGLLDEHGVDSLFSDGVTSLVLSDVALPPLVAPNETPSARVALSTASARDLPTVLTDETLSDAVTAGASPDGDPQLSLQRFLAETLMIEAEAPSTAERSIVVAPSRRWSPSATYATDLLADTGKVPWLSPTTLGGLLAGPPDTGIERSPLNYPSSARHAELPASYLHQVTALQHSLTEFTDILPPGDPATHPFGTALLRALSSSWRQAPSLRHRRMTELTHRLGAVMSQVRIASAPNSFVTLTSHGGKVPVTVANNLDSAVNVTVQLDANQRLSLARGGRVTVAIPAHQRTSVDVRADAKTSGVFPLKVQLLTPTGKHYGPRVQLYVRSTVYGTITLVITGAATAALLVAVAVRLTRRALAARRTSDPAGTA